MNNNAFLSVIIPVHNEERRLSPCIEKIVPYLSKHYTNFEIVVVNNGSTDGTKEICTMYEHTYRNFYSIHLPDRGKGQAVKRGMLFANGKFRYMCDVDLSTPICELPRFMERIYKADIVIGSRELVRAGVRSTITRRFMGRIFHLITADLVPGVLDTQCGFKLFSHVAAEGVFGNLKLNSMAFDVEALYLAHEMGFRTFELPVQWTHDPDSRVRWHDALTMARDVAAIPWLHPKIEKKYQNSLG